MFRPRLRVPSSLGAAARSLPLVSTQPAAAQAWSCRRIHHLPYSRHNPQLGVPGLLSAEGYDIAWTQHMDLMLKRLNQLVTGTDYEDCDLKKIILDTARSPSQAAVFNHASMAHNTDFFFKQLRSANDPPTNSSADGSGHAAGPEIPASLRTTIEENFGSVETLHREFAATANAMFGPGFVWLVKANQLQQTGKGGDNLRLLATYLAGSPYPGAHWRRQAVDMNTVGAETDTNANGNPVKQWLDRQAAAIHPESNPATGPLGAPVDRSPPGGIDVTPLLCLSTWEHVWLRDYGLGKDGYGGKTAFVEAWWHAIDWDAVAGMANLNRPNLMT